MTEERESYEQLLEERNRYRKLVQDILRAYTDDVIRWREAGLSYSSIRDVMLSYEDEDITFGKVVEEIRGLASAAVAEYTHRHEGALKNEFIRYVYDCVCSASLHPSKIPEDASHFNKFSQTLPQGRDVSEITQE